MRPASTTALPPALIDPQPDSKSGLWVTAPFFYISLQPLTHSSLTWSKAQGTHCCCVLVPRLGLKKQGMGAEFAEEKVAALFKNLLMNNLVK